MATLNVMRTVWPSTASTAFTSWNRLAALQAPSGSMQYAAVNATSAAVNGLPSDQTTSSRSRQVIDRRSVETPPLSMVGISAANAGTISPFSS